MGNSDPAILVYDPAEWGALLVSMLERALTTDEQTRLRKLAAGNSDCQADLALIELLNLRRASAQIRAGDRQAWERFQAIAHARGPVSKWAAKFPSARGAARQPLPRRPGRTLLLLAVVLVQFLLIAALWLQPGVQLAGLQLAAQTAPCSAFLIRVPDNAPAGALRRALAQARLRITDGPDANGRFVVAGTASLEAVRTLMGDLGSDVDANPLCRSRF